MDRDFTRWGHGRGKSISSDQMELGGGMFLCHGCVRDLDAEGNVLDDPDMMLRVAAIDRDKKYSKGEELPSAKESALALP
jgi:hypothetical protein